MSFLSTIRSLFGLKTSPNHGGKNGRTLQCEDCQSSFIFDSGEERFFRAKGFTDPKRCPHCRKRMKSRMKKKSRPGHRRSFRRQRRSSLIDGDSPYADTH